MISKRTLFFILGALCLLLIPFFAMQFQIAGWDWTGSDFALMSVLLAAFGVALAAATNKNYPRSTRAIGIALVVLVLLTYVHMAVGLVDGWPLAGS